MERTGNIRTEEQRIGRRMERFSLLRQILVGFVAISFLNIAISHIFPTPVMYSIASRNKAVEQKYDLLRDRIRTLESRIGDVRHRDVYIYRSLFSADTVQVEVPSFPASDYGYLEGDQYSSLLLSAWKETDRLACDIYSASVSLDELQILAKNKEHMSQAIPAIWPIDRTEMQAFYSFGFRRIHPIYGTRVMHKGVDLACHKGVPVYATGDAIVEFTDNGMPRRGYGKQILLNHEFGYKTRYAHLNRILVHRGEKVTRGQIIAEAGSTGGSTGTHLHYEVLFMGHNVNPVNYFNKNMTSDEYRTLIESSDQNSDLESR